MYVRKAFRSVSAGAIITMMIATASIAKSKSSAFQGYLLDRQCADSVREDSDPEDFIKHHTKDCALMVNCRRKGYSLYVKPNWFDLDKHGNKLAVKVLQKSPRRNAFYIQVEGTTQAGILKVKDIVEVAEPVAKVDAETK